MTVDEVVEDLCAVLRAKSCDLDTLEQLYFDWYSIEIEWSDEQNCFIEKGEEYV